MHFTLHKKTKHTGQLISLTLIQSAAYDLSIGTFESLEFTKQRYTVQSELRRNSLQWRDFLLHKKAEKHGISRGKIPETRIFIRKLSNEIKNPLMCTNKEKKNKCTRESRLIVVVFHWNISLKPVE